MFCGVNNTPTRTWIFLLVQIDIAYLNMGQLAWLGHTALAHLLLRVDSITTAAAAPETMLCWLSPCLFSQ